MTNAEYIKLNAQITILREIVVEYQGKTIENIIQQMGARVKDAEKDIII